MFQDGVAKAFFGETTLEEVSASLCKSLWPRNLPCKFAYHLVAKSAKFASNPRCTALHVNDLSPCGHPLLRPDRDRAEAATGAQLYDDKQPMVLRTCPSGGILLTSMLSPADLARDYAEGIADANPWYLEHSRLAVPWPTRS